MGGIAVPPYSIENIIPFMSIKSQVKNAFFSRINRFFVKFGIYFFAFWRENWGKIAGRDTPL